MTNLDSVLKSRDITLPTKVHIIKATVFPVVLYGCESWIIKKAECQRIDAFKLWCWGRFLSPLDNKEIKSVHLKGNQPWILGRTDAKAEAPVFWSSDANRQLIGKIPDAGKDWGQKRVSEDEMAGWHHRGKGHKLGQTSGDGEGQRGLVFCSPWVAESDMTGQLNNDRTKFCNKSWMPMLPCKLLCHLGWVIQ